VTDTYWAIEAEGMTEAPHCEIFSLDQEDADIHYGGRMVYIRGRSGIFVGGDSLFRTEAEAVTHALGRATHLAGYWERQQDILRRRLHQLTTSGGQP
jgi:hypothetical protein